MRNLVSVFTHFFTTDALVAHAAPDPLMIKLAIKLAIAALIANAAWQAGRTFAAHYQFRDEVRQAALVRGQTDAQLQQRVLELAADYDIPLTADAIDDPPRRSPCLCEGSYLRVVPTRAARGVPVALRLGSRRLCHRSAKDSM